MQKKILIICLATLISFNILSCSKFKPADARSTPTNAMERARKNVEEGRGVSIGNILKRDKNTNYEFSTSNPMWRATLETLDFIPLSVVDYSGGIIVTDWYGEKFDESLKILIRFMYNEVRAYSIKVIVHQKICSSSTDCKINVLNSKIRDELLTSIIKKAAILEKETNKN